MKPTELLLLAGLLLSSGCSRSPEPCTDEWNSWVEQAVATADDQGHGPDLGSDEWKSVVEFRLGLRGDRSVPHRDDVAWCRHIDTEIRNNR